ncbi:MAG: N-acetyl-gamma-glutamyl-phosphate reductase [Bacteroidetes bacterium]|nr:MAG: N-acetyl-gamma-glutamyl-phosphate reductase [Bacteroidota bacterium]
MIQAGIIGGAGYTAGELIRILHHHPNVELAFVQSESQAGSPVSHIHTDLVGELSLTFTNRPDWDVDVLFLCMGHGRSKAFMEKHPIPPHLKIIDLSHDFRLKDDAHEFVYGLPEWQGAQLSQKNHIANPGCFATAIQLALLPLANAGLLQSEVHIHAITGSTGAGQQPGETTHFSWRNNNVSVYKPFRHQHLGEIRQTLRQLQPDFEADLNFLPVRGNFSRGIFASLYTRSSLSQKALSTLFEAYYEDAPFVVITAQNPDLKQVVNTNKCLLFPQKIGDKILIISLIDNLLKGASGQAVQNMNLAFGLEETAGLRLKAMAF